MGNLNMMPLCDDDMQLVMAPELQVPRGGELALDWMEELSIELA
jgi:hypothetical protein